MNAVGIGFKEGLLKRSRDEIRNEFEKTINFHLVEAIEPDQTRIQKRLQTYREQNKKDRVLTHPDEVMIDGTIILDLLGSDWIVVMTHWRGEVIQTCEIMKVKRKMKWMNGDKLVETRMDIIDEPTLKGLSDNPFFTLPRNTQLVLCQLDPETVSIKRGKRLMLLGVPHKVTKIDRTSYENVLIIYCEEDLIGPTDTEDVCDFIAPEPILPLSIKGPDALLSGRKFVYSMYVGDTEESQPVTWEITGGFGLNILENKAEVTAIGKIGDAETLTATSANGVVSKIVSVKGLL